MQDRQKSHKRVPLFNRGQKYLQWIDNTQKEKMKRKRNIEKGKLQSISQKKKKRKLQSSIRNCLQPPHNNLHPQTSTRQ